MTVVLTINDTGSPKLEIVRLAYGSCGVSDEEFDLTPEDLNKALRKLNAMMREWPWSGLSYVQPDYGVGGAADLSGVDSSYDQAIADELGLRIAPTIGKTVSPEQRRNATLSRATALSAAASIPTVAIPAGTPRGSGKRRFSPFIAETG